MVINSGASHNYVSSNLVQALHLPVVTIQTSEITLHNGSKMLSKIACKIHVELRPGVVRKITFVVADVSMPFVLGMQWLRSNNVRVSVVRVQVLRTGDPHNRYWCLVPVCASPARKRTIT